MASDDVITRLTAEMAAAAEAQDYERATVLRNEIAVLRQGTDSADDAGDFAGLQRQQPGAMGIGSERPRRTPPAGWTPPAKPDLMTGKRKPDGRR